MKVRVNLEILGNEIEIEIEAPERFKNWTTFDQMDYIEEKIVSKINYSWDY